MEPRASALPQGVLAGSPLARSSFAHSIRSLRSPIELHDHHVNKVHHVTAINRLAENLGENEEAAGGRH